MRIFRLFCFFFLFALSACVPPPAPVEHIVATTRHLHAQAPTLDPYVITLALKAYNVAQYRGLNHPHLLTIVDFSQPSSQKRLWVIDVEHERVLFNTWVAHGKNSGKSQYATQFSDRIDSRESSIGVYVTGQALYHGHFGYALRLQGLEPNYNAHAQARAIVIHGAPYVSKNYLHLHHQMGTTWGCFALDETVLPQIISKIQGGTLLFAYYPDKDWLQHSEFLNPSPSSNS